MADHDYLLHNFKNMFILMKKDNKKYTCMQHILNHSIQSKHPNPHLPFRNKLLFGKFYVSQKHFIIGSRFPCLHLKF